MRMRARRGTEASERARKQACTSGRAGQGHRVHLIFFSRVCVTNQIISINAFFISECSFLSLHSRACASGGATYFLARKPAFWTWAILSKPITRTWAPGYSLAHSSISLRTAEGSVQPNMGSFHMSQYLLW